MEKKNTKRGLYEGRLGLAGNGMGRTTDILLDLAVNWNW